MQETWGLTPDPGRSHMRWAPQLLSQCSRAREPRPPKPLHPRACALQQQKPPQSEACALQPESSTCSLQLEKNPHSNEEPGQPKNKMKYIFFFKNERTHHTGSHIIDIYFHLYEMPKLDKCLGTENGLVVA